MRKTKYLKSIKSQLIFWIKDVFVVLCFFTGIFLIINNIPIIKNSVTLATSKKPETLTELYFEDHNNLPKRIEGKLDYSFTFSIHNLEYEDVNYTYVIYLQKDNSRFVLESGNVLVKNSEYVSIKKNFLLLEPGRVKVTVELVDKKQSIHFWIEE